MSAMTAEIAAVLFADVDSPIECQVLLVLGIMSKRNGFVTASVSDLQRWTRLSERTVQRALASLERARHLSRYHAPGETTTHHLHPRGR